MTIVSDGWEYTMVLMDTGRNTATRTFRLIAADAAEAATGSAAIRTAVLAATDAKLSQAKLSEVFIDDAFSLPLGGVQIENQAMFVFELDGDPRKTATWFLPAPKIDVFVSTSGKNSNVVDTSDALVTAIRGLFDDSTGVATISDGETALLIQSGKRIHRKSTRG